MERFQFHSKITHKIITIATNHTLRMSKTGLLAVEGRGSPRQPEPAGEDHEGLRRAGQALTILVENQLARGYNETDERPRRPYHQMSCMASRHMWTKEALHIAKDALCGWLLTAEEYGVW